jgi:hypothetical protein
VLSRRPRQRRPVWAKPPQRGASHAALWLRRNVLRAAAIGVIGGIIGAASAVYTLWQSRRMRITITPAPVTIWTSDDPAPMADLGDVVGVRVINDSARPTNLIAARLYVGGQLIGSDLRIYADAGNLSAEERQVRPPERTEAPVAVPAGGSVLAAVDVDWSGLASDSGPGKRIQAVTSSAFEDSLPGLDDTGDAPAANEGSSCDEVDRAWFLKHFKPVTPRDTHTRTIKALAALEPELALQFDPGGWKREPLRPRRRSRNTP